MNVCLFEWEVILAQFICIHAHIIIYVSDFMRFCNQANYYLSEFEHNTGVYTREERAERLFRKYFIHS